MLGEKSESIAGDITWTDVNIETFARFAQFAYTEDYSVPKMIVDDCCVPPKTADKYKSSALPKKSPMKSFDSPGYTVDPRNKWVEKSEPTITNGSSENIREVLLVHASLYALGEKWGVEKLKVLALYKLHRTLSIYPLDLEKLQHIVDLVRYTYSDERIPDLINGIDKLRELVCCYIASRTEVSLLHNSFLTLLVEGGPFVRDFWKIAVPVMFKG